VNNGQFRGQPARFNEQIVETENEKDRYFSNLFDLQSTSFLSGAAFLKNEISYYDQIEEESFSDTSDYRLDIAAAQNYFYTNHRERIQGNDLRIRTLEGKSGLDVQLTPFYELRAGFNYQRIRFRQETFDSDRQRAVQYRSLSRHQFRSQRFLRTRASQRNDCGEIVQDRRLY
jgi:hypothetical protein